MPPSKRHSNPQQYPAAPRAGPKKKPARKQVWLKQPPELVLTSPGRNVSIPCHIKDPPAYVAWYKLDQGVETLIEPFNRTHLPEPFEHFKYAGDDSLGENHLEITSVKLSDTGVYKCKSERRQHLEDPVDELYSFTNLTVQEPVASTAGTPPLLTAAITCLSGIAACANQTAPPQYPHDRSRLALANSPSAASTAMSHYKLPLVNTAPSTSYGPTQGFPVKSWLLVCAGVLFVSLLALNCYLVYSLVRKRRKLKSTTTGSTTSSDLSSPQRNSSNLALNEHDDTNRRHNYRNSLRRTHEHQLHRGLPFHQANLDYLKDDALNAAVA